MGEMMIAKVLAVWAIAALVVISVDLCIHGRSAMACDVAKLTAILIVSFVYMRFVAREATVDHALVAGATWLTLSIVAELATTTRSGHGWFILLGSPDSAMRNVLMFAWIFAPSLFARHRGADA